MSSIDDLLDVLIIFQTTIRDANGDEFVEKIEEDRKEQTNVPPNSTVSSRFDETLE